MTGEIVCDESGYEGEKASGSWTRSRTRGDPTLTAPARPFAGSTSVWNGPRLLFGTVPGR